ncbi:MAG: ATP12 family chaperone protein [Hyphomicrobiales bacterium]
MKVKYDDLPRPDGTDVVVDPVALAHRDLAGALPRRFWARVDLGPVEQGFHLLLDGRPARTPARRPLALPNEAVGRLVAEEWTRIGETIDPSLMPCTKIVNSAIDGVAHDIAGVRADFVKYAESDLLCYRTRHPERLAELQKESWDPILAWGHARFGARFTLAEGIVYVEQPKTSIAAIANHVSGISDVFHLAALHVVTTLTGSVLLALAVSENQLSTGDAWTLAHLDEDFQMEVWGHDEEAMARRAMRGSDMEAACRLMAATPRRDLSTGSGCAGAEHRY